MTIQQLTICHFGSITFYEADLTPDLNLIDSRHISELSTVLAVLMCSQPSRKIPKMWLWDDTRISARIRLGNRTCTLHAASEQGRLHFTVTDPSGNDITAFYLHTLSHCPEQDSAEHFDGQDKTIPLRLCHYRNWADCDDLSGRTQRLAETKTFRKHLRQYIRTFQPEPINCEKNYQTAINAQGQFQVLCPGYSGKACLSETEQKLFRYICFLNIAAFWADIEKVRDMHHEKKPLLVQNFIERLDESVNISGLIARTQSLKRQIIILASPMGENLNKKWVGKHNGIFFESVT